MTKPDWDALEYKVHTAFDEAGMALRYERQDAGARWNKAIAAVLDTFEAGRAETARADAAEARYAELVQSEQQEIDQREERIASLEQQIAAHAPADKNRLIESLQQQLVAQARIQADIEMLPAARGPLPSAYPDTEADGMEFCGKCGKAK